MRVSVLNSTCDRNTPLQFLRIQFLLLTQHASEQFEMSHGKVSEKSYMKEYLSYLETLC